MELQIVVKSSNQTPFSLREEFFSCNFSCSDNFLANRNEQGQTISQLFHLKMMSFLNSSMLFCHVIPECSDL